MQMKGCQQSPTKWAKASRRSFRLRAMGVGACSSMVRERETETGDWAEALPL